MEVLVIRHCPIVTPNVARIIATVAPIAMVIVIRKKIKNLTFLPRV
jgi:hypothetical protein